MTFTNIALDKFFSQDLSKLTTCNAPSLEHEFDQAEHWVGNFILNSVCRVNVRTEAKPFIFGILRRAQMLLVEYHSGRAALLDYLSGSKDRISVYFRALYHFEIAITLTYQAYEILMKMTEKRLFTKNDGSPIQRLNRVYDVSKHLESSSIPNHHLHAVWLSNEGVCISNVTLQWSDIAELIKEIGNLANTLSNPKLHDVESTKD